MAVRNYSGRLFPVTAGQLISVVGKSINNPQRFDIDLLSRNGQGNDSGDIHLHVSVRFHANECAIVRNTHRKGVGWGTEERQDNLIIHNSLNPFIPGGDFKIDFFVDKAAYFISIDGKPFCTYGHRLPIESIQMINVYRDIEAVYQVNQTNAQARPWPVVNVNSFEAFAPGQFNPGNVVVITAMPRGNACGDFSLSFYDGSNRNRTHFHLRAFVGQRNISVTSQQENEHWHQSLTLCPQPFPFNINQVFKLAIGITNFDFQVAVNGQRVTSWQFRDHRDRLLGSMTGIVLTFNNGLNLDVRGVEYMNLEPTCAGFENFTRL